MQKFDIAQWAREANPRARKTVTLRPMPASLAAEEALRKVIIDILRELANHVRERVLPAAYTMRTQLRIDRQDQFEAEMAEFRNLFERILNASRAMTARAFEIEEARHRQRFTEAVRSSIGIDLAGILQSRDVADYMATAMQRSVAMIKGLGDDMAKRLEVAIIQEVTQGAANRLIAKRIADEFDFAQNRAKLIARDQVATWNGELNKVRQLQAGIEKYVWSSSLDERVRAEHRAREGRTYRWDDPPHDGHPGLPINCRCTARAVIDID